MTMAAEKLGYTEESVGRADESALNAFITSYGKSPISYASFINTASYMPSLDMKGVSETDRDHSQSRQRRAPVSSLDAVPTTYCGTNMTVSTSLSAPKRPTGSNESQSAMI